MKSYLFIFALLFTGFYHSVAAQTSPTESMERGGKLYKSKCAVCHKKDGTGKGKSYPPLALSDFLVNYREASIRGIKYGFEEPLTVNGNLYKKEMKPVPLSNTEIADVMNFITNSWGNTTDKLTTAEEVEAIQKE